VAVSSKIDACTRIAKRVRDPANFILAIAVRISNDGRPKVTIASGLDTLKSVLEAVALACGRIREDLVVVLTTIRVASNTPETVVAVFGDDAVCKRDEREEDLELHVSKGRCHYLQDFERILVVLTYAV
jgi:hypothetical protein